MGRKPASKVQQRRGRRLAAELRRQREESGRSREDVARLAGVSTETIKAIEDEKSLNPTFFTVVDVARELGVRLTALDKATREAR